MHLKPRSEVSTQNRFDEPDTKINQEKLGKRKPAIMAATAVTLIVPYCKDRPADWPFTLVQLCGSEEGGIDKSQTPVPQSYQFLVLMGKRIIVKRGDDLSTRIGSWTWLTCWAMSKEIWQISCGACFAELIASL